MKKVLFSILVMPLLLTFAMPVLSADIGGAEIDITADFTYATKYMWHGYDIFDGHGAYMPSIDFGYQGFNVGFWAAYPSSSGYEDLTEFDYYISYGRSFFEDQVYAVDASVGYTYFDFPKTSGFDASEVFLSVAFPSLIPIGPSTLVPSYTMYYDFEGFDSDQLTNIEGFYNTFGLSYSLPIKPFLKDQEEQSLDFMFDITHDDGVYGAQSDWSYSTIGVSTTYDYKGFYFTPGINYQFNLNDIVNTEDDFYATFSVGYAF
ncbi:hypothetical protein GF373_16020 [bacterium]|nr:hypothetical protein [bacterium]